MPLEGLRAWIGEVERKLGTRTRVFLVLAVIAVGGSGAAIYLAIDARESSVGEGDVQALQEKLEAQIAAGGAGATGTQATLEAEIDALRTEVEKLRDEGGGSRKGNGGGGDTSSGGTSNGGASTEDKGTEDERTSTDEASRAKAKEPVERSQEQSQQAEAEQTGK